MFDLRPEHNLFNVLPYLCSLRNTQNQLLNPHEISIIKSYQSSRNTLSKTSKKHKENTPRHHQETPPQHGICGFSFQVIDFLFKCDVWLWFRNSTDSTPCFVVLSFSEF